MKKGDCTTARNIRDEKREVVLDFRGALLVPGIVPSA
jgi:hypothetical protein